VSYSCLREQLLVERYLAGGGHLPAAVRARPACARRLAPCSPALHTPAAAGGSPASRSVPPTARASHSCCPPPHRSPSRAPRPLPQGYWIGVARESAGAAWAAFDEAPLPQAPSNAPYGHWGWSFAGDALTPGANCGLASSSTAYDFYNGDRWAPAFPAAAPRPMSRGASPGQRRPAPPQTHAAAPCLLPPEGRCTPAVDLWPRLAQVRRQPGQPGILQRQQHRRRVRLDGRRLQRPAAGRVRGARQRLPLPAAALAPDPAAPAAQPASRRRVQQM
jgi:hypothetical protein